MKSLAALMMGATLFGWLAAPEGQAQPSLFAPPAAERATEEPATLTEDDFISPPELPQVTGAAPASPAITVDAQGRKTLTLRGDGASAAPGVTVDAQGRKTLTIIGDVPAAPEGTSPWHTVPSVPAGAAEEAAAEEAAPMEQRPYWLQKKATETRPYWQKPEEAPAAPYWQAKETAESVPYWWPEHLRKAAEAKAAAAKVAAAPANFAPAIHDAAAPQAVKTREISVYMFKDDQGVVHITNVPADPRFRLFNITVVDIKVQRGLHGVTGGRRRFTRDSLRPYILKAAATYNLDPALIAAVIRSESAFDAGAVSWAGAQGLMQLMPQTARSVGCRDPFDPEDNIMGGSRYLRWMLDRFGGNLDLAIAAYNCGPTRVAREWRIPNIPETRNYVVIVKRNYQQYQGEF